MPLLSRARSILSAADRRLAEAQKLFSAAPAPAVAASPFGPGQQSAPRSPPSTWLLDQPPPPPHEMTFQAGYHDHTYHAGGAPQGFEGWDVERIRAAVAAHRQGFFLESSTLSVVVRSFAPVLASLAQAIAPAIGLDRYLRGGSRGLARVVAAELEEQLVPRVGLLPSPYFPPVLWGTMAIDLRMMGFAVLQHVDGDPDPDTGIRPRYSRIWPTWAVTYQRQRRTFMAQTTERVVDITNDGHFTLIADEEEPHFGGAVAALGEEVLSGRLTQQMRNTWINKYGQPKLVGTMPEKTGLNTPEGIAYFAALQTIVGPGGIGALPYGSKLEFAGLSGEASGSFKEALDSVIVHIAMALLGSDGTIRAGGEGGAGPYRAPGFWGVRRDLVSRMLMAIVRGVNGGHVAPYVDFNYAEGRAEAKARGIWVDPAIDIPLPDPDADARMASHADRAKLRHEIVAAERKAGLVVTQERVDKLSEALDLDTIAVGDLPIEQWEVVTKLIAPDELRKRRGLPELPNGAGSLDRLAAERLAGKDETGGAPPPAQGESSGPTAPTLPAAPSEPT